MSEEVFDNELILMDRIAAIQAAEKKYDLENNAYLSFSGGKDSTVLHHLLDMALPNNHIPRVYSNTGIEYLSIVKYVKELDDSRIVIIQPSHNIKETLEKYGYPFKSKEYSHWLLIYQRNSDEIDKYIEMIENDKSLLENYDFIRNLPKGVKTAIKSFYGIREREREVSTSMLHIPNRLKYQFNQNFKLKISDACCLKMKEEPLRKWEKQNNKNVRIMGIMADEGGRRALRGKCITIQKGISFSPLIKVTKEWEDWFMDKYNIKLCELYYPPFNFERTGCKGCPFALELQKQLDIMEMLLPNEKRQCEIIWKPVYDEYRRTGYRLRKDDGQLSLFETERSVYGKNKQ